MNRRKFIMGTGATAAGGASLLGSGAFTSVAAERSVNINVAGDANAFLRLAPCKGSGNGDYVTGAQSGAMSIDLSDGNQDVGDGVNPEALTRIDNIFEICNQGTQDICVDFEITVPEIEGEVPDRYDFEQGDPAVIFYRGSNRDAFVSTEGPNTDRPGAISLPLDNGTCECIGMEIRSFGFSDEDLFADTDLTIVAEADADCTGAVDPDPGAPGPSPAGLVGYWPLDELSGGITPDAVGMADGTWEGGTGDPTTSGIVGGSFSFDGASDYVDVEYGDGDEIVFEDWTVSSWIRPSDWSSDARKEWLSVSEDQTTAKPLDFVHEEGEIRHYRGQAAAEVMSHDVSSQQGWHHMVVSQKRNDNTTVDLSMYFDGEQVDTDSGDYENMRPSETLYIGRIAGSDPDRFYWEGRIDDVRLYDRVLGESEIANLYDAGDGVNSD